MKKLLFYLLPFIMYSCTFDDNGNPQLADWFIVTIALFVVIIIIALVNGSYNSSSIKKILINKGYILDEFISIGSYIGGHPTIDDKIEFCSLYITDDIIKIFDGQNFTGSYKVMGKIPIKSIQDIKTEDSSTFDKRVTLGRVLLVGVFALAWKKNKKQDNVFLIIEWHDGKFKHETSFGYFNKNAYQDANKMRNILIKNISKKNT